ncbi:MAG TPA: LytTR family DNA-binding domain-containing protein [Bacteroidia bacterium]|nr:LytTR family DNA-binding domain-containing protein [Bacteroidia bacterium]
MININFAKPYPLNESLKDRIQKCFLFGLFVFIFLYVFRPFEISGLKNYLFIISLGYGLVCTAIMFILNVLLFNALPNYFSEAQWTTKRELVWSVINLLCIGTANFVYSYFLGITDINIDSLMMFLTYTLAVGIFPITGVVIIKFNRLNNKYETESEALNPIIEAESEINKPQSNEFVNFLSENGTIELEILPSQFLFAKADDNYVELYFLKDGIKDRKVLRNSLKNIHSFLPPHENFYRCHKSFVINLDQVNHISGNAQGYKFHLKNAQELIPVSRSNNDFVKNYFTNRPKNTQIESKSV